jgi:anti-anti-sigma regulatory factor
MRTEIHQGVLVAHISVACIKDKQAGLLRQSLLAMVKERRGRLALDLSNVTDFTCSWINVMLEVTRACRRENWDFAIFGLRGTARAILRATHLDRKMTVCSCRDEALGKLGIDQPTMWERLVGNFTNPAPDASQPDLHPAQQAQAA